MLHLFGHPDAAPRKMVHLLRRGKHGGDMRRGRHGHRRRGRGRVDGQVLVVLGLYAGLEQ